MQRHQFPHWPWVWSRPLLRPGGSVGFKVHGVTLMLLVAVLIPVCWISVLAYCFLANWWRSRFVITEDFWILICDLMHSAIHFDNGNSSSFHHLELKWRPLHNLFCPLHWWTWPDFGKVKKYRSDIKPWFSSLECTLPHTGEALSTLPAPCSKEWGVKGKGKKERRGGEKNKRYQVWREIDAPVSECPCPDVI